MSVTINLKDALIRQLQEQARVERLPVEDFAVKLIAEGVELRSRSASCRTKNQRRVELIRKSTRHKLSADEAAELQRLQAELDEQLGGWDEQLLGELRRMEHAVASLPDE